LREVATTIAEDREKADFVKLMESVKLKRKERGERPRESPSHAK
jgi:hypothetical protein